MSENAAAYLVRGAQEVNGLAPELGPELESIMASVEGAQNVLDDPAFAAYRIQTLGHLRHVSFDFKLADDSPDYVHAPVIEGPYPGDPTARQLGKARTFVSLTAGEQAADTTPFGPEDLEKLEDIRRSQFEIDRKVIDHPDASYADFRQRMEKDGFDAEFPEFAPTLDYIQERLLSGQDVAEGCERSGLVTQLREIALQAITDARFGQDQEPKTPKYRESIYAIETALEFFDVMQRSGEDMPPLYHSDRYEYYLHFLLAQQDHILYPTITGTGATDLMKLRQVPIGVAGVTTEVNYVDGFPQSSYEFFHHDVNHSRRMYQFFKEKAAELGISPEELSERGSKLMTENLLPSIKINPNDSEETRQLKRTSRMLLFEIMHEDALPAERDAILQAMFREPLARTPFERIVDGNTVEYFMEAGATTLAYAYRKLAHTFYDRPGERMSALGSEGLRNRYVVVNAAMQIYRALGGTGLRDEEAIEQFEQLVSTDEGFPDAFFETVTDDIEARRDEKDGDFGFFVALPKSAEQTIEAIRDAGKRVVTLFGYSDLGYARPDLLERQIGEDLGEYDPDDTLVVIGATAAGIGKGYDVAADMGFETAGIVSTKVLAHDGKFSQNAGDVHLVRDSQWGGYMPGTIHASPTTEAFVGSADVLLSYGGGYNTAVALREAKRRGGIVLRHRQHAMSEDGQDGKPYGEALQVWEEVKD